jgi:uncharacterized protein YyaL (SSP411 family)
MEWGEEAFERAISEDKPIFLSIGYSTCHWCHVMAHESFEDEDVAEILNERFISIKLDREERPDLDSFYMSAVQMLTGSGGWPLTLFLTHDKKPFFGGTYFPKESKYNRIGLIDLLHRIDTVWKEERQKAVNSADSLIRGLKEYSQSKDKPSDLNQAVVERAFQELCLRFDSTNGGFGSRPKFPTPHNLIFLLDYWSLNQNQKALEMVSKTLTSMRKGGVWDHVGFGFHRYSTDAEWRLPHFEKMLYDQALLMRAFAYGYFCTKDELFKQTTLEIFDYLKDKLITKEGAFYSAEDADSEGEEGKFYLWSYSDLEKILEPHEFDEMIKAFSLREEGNFFDEATGELTGENLLYIEGEDFYSTAQWEGVRKKLYKARELKEHPFKDEKILCDWNALLISSLAQSSRFLSEPKLLEAAINALQFLENKMSAPNGLIHSVPYKNTPTLGFLDDYAFLIDAYIQMHQTTFEISYLEKATLLMKEALVKFWDEENGGFNFAQKGTDSLINQKDPYDGAIPSGNSVMALNLLSLSLLTGDLVLIEKMNQQFQSFSGKISEHPSSHCQFVNALQMKLNEKKFVLLLTNQELDHSQRDNWLKKLDLQTSQDLILFASKENKSFLPLLEGKTFKENKLQVFECTLEKCLESQEYTL